ncbi:MAG: hypothetical protein QG656_2672 [Candidatus Hydrogenedentes bacterium]|nr:hypothetical protein [Candidatus Hydrogenedentota bacterium]
MTKDEVRSVLEQDLPPLARKVEMRHLDALEREFRSWSAAAGNVPRGLGQAAEILVDFLNHRLRETLDRITSQRARYGEFNQRFVRAASQEERRQHIMDYIRDRGTAPREMAKDLRAFNRWFGHDAMADRYARQLAAAERNMAFCLHRLGVAAKCALEMHAGPPGHDRLWRRLEIEPIVRRLVAYEGDNRVSIEAFRCLATALLALPQAYHEGCVEERTLQYVFRSALESRQNVWIQCEALTLLQELSPGSLQAALEKRLADPREGDDLFVRHHVVSLLGKNCGRIPALLDLLPMAAADSSPYVRQALAKALLDLPVGHAGKYLRQLALEDDVAEVRAAAMVEIPALALRPGFFDIALDVSCESLRREQAPFVLRTAFKAACDGLDALGAGEAAVWYAALRPEMDRIHREAESLSVRRWAAMARERMWCSSYPPAKELRARLETALKRTPRGIRRGVSRKAMRTVDETTLGRVLSVLSQEDFGYDIELGLLTAKATRGNRFGFRMWRFLHELTHPSPDKRQAFKHTVGRMFRGRLRAPSGILNELSETKVPGEPLYIENEAGGRPYLPLVDEVLSNLDWNSARRPLRIFSPEGVTELAPPRFVLTRVFARVWLTLRFVH